VRAYRHGVHNPESFSYLAPTAPSRRHLPLEIIVLEVLERKLDILDQRCRDLSHIQEGFAGRLERPEPLQYFISHLKYRTRLARHFETSWTSQSFFHPWGTLWDQGFCFRPCPPTL